MTNSQVPSTASRVTIGLTPQGVAALAVVMDKKWFATEAGAFKAAVAFALANDLPPTSGGSYNTIWNVGSLDRGGDFNATVSLLLGVADAWSVIPALGDAGLRALADRAPVADVPTEALILD